MNHALGLLLDGADLVGMHRNRYWRTAEGFSLDTGAYLAALEGAAEVTATVLGKPSPDFFATAVAELGVEREHVAMVGDDVQNDVLAAQAVGLHGVLVRTGKFRPETLEGLDDMVKQLQRPPSAIQRARVHDLARGAELDEVGT